MSLRTSVIVFWYYFSDTFVSTVYPPRKNVVILVDHGNSLSKNQFNMAKAMAKQVLSSLNEDDRVR